MRPARSHADTAVINEMKKFVAVKSGDASIGGAGGAKAKFSNDYNAGKFKDVIADGELLKKYNVLTPQTS